MTVEGVNNSNNHAGLYAACAALIGGGAGVGAAYLTKPYLKNGMPTDTFTSEVSKGIANKFGHLDKHGRNTFNAAISDIDALSSIDGLKNLIKRDGAEIWRGLLLFDGNTDNTRKLLNEAIDPKNLKKSKNNIKTMILAEKSKLPTDIASTFFAEACHESGFKLPTKISGTIEAGTVDVIKTAAKSIQNKYALIYGAIGAGVLGLGTLLCCGGKKK